MKTHMYRCIICQCDYGKLELVNFPLVNIFKAEPVCKFCARLMARVVIPA